jgi:hypothetical protein
MAARANVLDHQASKPARYLRDHRLRITLWIGAIEGLLTLLFISHLVVYVLAVVAIVFYVMVGRQYKSSLARQLAWIFAASQLLAVLVPIVLFIAKWVAVTAIAIIAVVGLVILFAERERV